MLTFHFHWFENPLPTTQQLNKPQIFNNSINSLDIPTHTKYTAAGGMDSPQDTHASVLTRHGSKSSALGQANSGGALNTKPTLLRIGEASALPVLLCGLLQKEVLLAQQKQQLTQSQPAQVNVQPQSNLRETSQRIYEEADDQNVIDVETFEEEFFGLLSQRYAQMMTSACLPICKVALPSTPKPTHAIMIRVDSTSCSVVPFDNLLLCNQLYYHIIIMYWNS